jgi:hypothetical protein
MHGKDRSLTLGFDGNGLLGICHHPDRPRICRIVLVTDVEGLNELCGHQLTLRPILDSALVRRWAPASFHPD